MRKHITLLFLLLFSVLSPAQNVKNVSPAKASQIESVILSITGDHTGLKNGEFKVKLIAGATTINANAVTKINDTLIEAAFTFYSSYPRTTYNLQITDIQTTSSYSLANAFTLYSAPVPDQPVLVSVYPTSAHQGDTIEVTVKSKNTHFFQPVQTLLLLCEIKPVSQSIIDDQTIKAKFIFDYSIVPGVYDVFASNPIDDNLTLKNSFTIIPGPDPQKLIDFFPKSANRLSSVTFTIIGKNTRFKKDSCHVVLMKTNDIMQPQKINYLNDTLMKASFEYIHLPANIYELLVYNPVSGQALNIPHVLTITDTLAAPGIIAVNPLVVKQGDSVIVTVKGTRTHFLFPGNDVNIGGMVGPVKTINDSTIQKTIFVDFRFNPSKYPVRVWNYIDGWLITDDSITVVKGNNPPRLISVSPNNAIQGQKTDILIHGSRNSFNSNSILSVVFKNNNGGVISPVYLQYRNDSTLFATFELNSDDMLVGGLDVIVKDQTYGRELSLTGGFTLNKNPFPPLIQSISPASASQFEMVTMQIHAVRSHFKEGVQFVRLVAADNSGINIDAMKVDILNDSILTAKFNLNSNYYAASLFNLSVALRLDGEIRLEKAFTINRIYTQEPKILSMDPKSAYQGQSITIHIKGSKGSFLPGKPLVRLLMIGGDTIPANDAEYINDSLISASFSFNKSHASGTNYYLNVVNKSDLMLYGFSLYTPQLTSKLVDATPFWSSQTDTTDIKITGHNTHFDSTDQIWLESRYGTKIPAIRFSPFNDTVTLARFEFKKSDVPGVYSVKMKTSNNLDALSLNNVFTLTGSMNTTSLQSVNPNAITCYSGVEKITINATRTHFTKGAYNIALVNRDGSSTALPVEMKILNDTVITAGFNMGSNCGEYDVLVTGDENYMLIGKLIVFTTVPVKPIEDGMQAVNIFPNPSTGLFTLNVNEDFENASLQVMDVLGKIILNRNEIQETTELDLSEAAPGMYYVKLIKNRICKTVKIMRQ